MYFVIQYVDRPDGSALRQEHRSDHVAYRRSLGEQLKLAGPLLSDQGEPNGSLVILEARDATEAEKIAKGDPYVSVGLFERVDISPYKVAFNRLPVTAG